MNRKTKPGNQKSNFAKRINDIHDNNNQIRVLRKLPVPMEISWYKETALRGYKLQACCVKETKNDRSREESAERQLVKSSKEDSWLCFKSFVFVVIELVLLLCTQYVIL